MNKNELTRSENLNVFFIFALFFMFLMLEHSLVYEYFDDYGYASLSFVNNVPDVQGTHFTFPQLVYFYKLHYMTVTGRIFFQSLMTITLSAGLWCIRTVQCAFITLIFFMIYKIVILRPAESKMSSGRNRVLSALAVCLSYGLLELYILDKSIYWFTASAVYLWPLLPFLFGIYILFRSISGESIRPAIKVAALLCLGFAAAAQEQISIASLFVLAALLVYKILKQRKLSAFEIFALLFVLSGCLFLFLAPANACRSEALKLEPSFTEYLNLPIVHRITVGARIMMQYLFSKNYFLLVLGLLSCGSYMSFMLIRKKKGLLPLNIMLLVFSILSVAAMLVYNDGLFTLIVAKGFSDKLAYLCIGFICLLLLYGYIRYYQAVQRPLMWILFLAGVLSAASVIVSFLPISGRLYIPFAIISLIVISDMICDFLSVVRSKHIKTVFFLLLMIVMASNVFNYTQKVYRTTGTNIKNALVLKESSLRIHNGENITVIHLEPYPNIESDALHPNSGTYTIYRQSTLDCIKEYYDLPPDITFVFDWDS